MGRPPNTEDRRRQIALAMMKLIALRGYEGATISGAARLAGLTPGLVHYHFTDKLEILLLVVDELASLHNVSLDIRLGTCGGNPSKELRQFIDAHLALPGKEVAGPPRLPVKKPSRELARALKSPWVPGGRVAVKCWGVIGHEAARNSRVAKAYRGVVRGLVARLAGIIRRGVTAGRFSCKEPEAAASMVVAGILGAFALDSAAPGVIPRGRAARSVLRMAQGLLWPIPDWDEEL
ncbi:MAG: TetR/AcrR family transcriptional regulator [Planctomycetes bacterium]|nr:TetR/AcrR family transcriptional regulator [Planctomycetota bacterium]